MRESMASRGCVIFVGNLPGDVREREVEDLFIKYGRIRHIDLKNPPRPPAFSFVEFEEPRDAQDAARGRDGYDFFGNRLRVEMSRGARDRGPPPAPPTFRGRGTGFRVLIKGLPISASWQDLKDHFRVIVKPAYTNVYRERGGVLGVVEFDTREDLERAIRKLDDTEFKNPFDRAYIRVIDESDDRGRSRSRSRSPRGRSVTRSVSRSASRSRSRSRGRSPARSASRSVSRSASPRRSKSRSVSKSPARSD